MNLFFFRLVYLKKTVKIVLKKNNKDYLLLNHEEWQALKDFITILQPFEIFTKTVEFTKEPTLPICVSALNKIKQDLVI